MTTTNHVEQTAEAVRNTLADAGRSQKSLSDETGIPYPTLNRKLKGQSEFQFSELILIAEALAVPPSVFTPDVFRSRAVRP